MLRALRGEKRRACQRTTAGGPPPARPRDPRWLALRSRPRLHSSLAGQHAWHHQIIHGVGTQHAQRVRLLLHRHGAQLGSNGAAAASRHDNGADHGCQLAAKGQAEHAADGAREAKARKLTHKLDGEDQAHERAGAASRPAWRDLPHAAAPAGRPGATCVRRGARRTGPRVPVSSPPCSNEDSCYEAVSVTLSQPPQTLRGRRGPAINHQHASRQG